jgi:hypothetical protein
MNKGHSRTTEFAYMVVPSLFQPATFPQGIDQATVLQDGLRPSPPNATFRMTLLPSGTNCCSTSPAVIREP